MIYKVASFIYKLSLVILIIIFLLGMFAAFASGHSAVVKITDILQLILLPITLTNLIIYQKKQNNHIFRISLLCLLFINIFFFTYLIYDTVFICKCFTQEDYLTTFTAGFLAIIALIVTIGVIKYKL